MITAYDPVLLRKAASYVTELNALGDRFGVEIAAHEGKVSFDLGGVTFHIVQTPEGGGLALGVGA